MALAKKARTLSVATLRSRRLCLVAPEPCWIWSHVDTAPSKSPASLAASKSSQSIRSRAASSGVGLRTPFAYIQACMLELMTPTASATACCSRADGRGRSSGGRRRGVAASEGVLLPASSPESRPPPTADRSLTPRRRTGP
eukprot:3059491-Prymnesium_polylepis.1